MNVLLNGWNSFMLLYIQLQYLVNFFNELNIELLLCVADLSSNDSLFTFDKKKLIHLAQFCSSGLSMELLMLYINNQLYDDLTHDFHVISVGLKINSLYLFLTHRFQEFELKNSI